MRRELQAMRLKEVASGSSRSGWCGKQDRARECVALVVAFRGEPPAHGAEQGGERRALPEAVHERPSDAQGAA